MMVLIVLQSTCRFNFEIANPHAPGHTHKHRSYAQCAHRNHKLPQTHNTPHTRTHAHHLRQGPAIKLLERHQMFLGEAAALAVVNIRQSLCTTPQREHATVCVVVCLGALCPHSLIVLVASRASHRTAHTRTLQPSPPLPHALTFREHFFSPKGCSRDVVEVTVHENARPRNDKNTRLPPRYSLEVASNTQQPPSPSVLCQRGCPPPSQRNRQKHKQRSGATSASVTCSIDFLSSVPMTLRITRREC
jgi:hypothetical protein